MTDKTLTKCNFCRPANELNSEEIPFWSKKKENYSPYPKMVSCDENYSLNNTSLKEVPVKLSDSALSLKLKLGTDASDKYVFFWAATEQSRENNCEINSDENAYGDYENHGMKKTDDKGNVTIQLNCPQPYKDSNQTYCRHVHYILESSEKTWLPLKTIRLICSVSIEELGKAIKNKDTLVICALPATTFNKHKQITGALNLPIDELGKLSDKVKDDKIMEFLTLNIKSYPKLNKLVKSKKLDIRDVPIITYCANKKCDASKKLLDALYKCKVNNTKEWHDGLEGWNESSSFYNDDDVDDEEDVDDEDVDDVDDGEDVDDEDVDDGDDEDDEDEDDEDEDDEDEDEDEDEDDEDEDEDEDEDNLLSVEHEGVDYIVIGDTFCDSYLDPIGKGTLDAGTGKVTDMDTKLQIYHDKNKLESLVEEDKEDKKEGKKDKGKKGDKEGKKDKGKKEVNKSITESVANKSDGYTRDYLGKAMKGDLKDIVKQLASRDQNTYSYENIKGMDKKELVKLVSVCQGKKYRVTTKTDYKFPSDKELDSMADDELRELVNSMTNREPDTYKYTESSWSKPKLIDFILQCQGIPKPRRRGSHVFVGGGWAI